MAKYNLLGNEKKVHAYVRTVNCRKYPSTFLQRVSQSAKDCKASKNSNRKPLTPLILLDQ